MRKVVLGALLSSIFLLVITSCDLSSEQPTDNKTNENTYSVTGAINGTLVDHNGQPIEGAKVEFHHNAEDKNVIGNSTTDAHGFFLISDLDPGFYTVSFLKDGYYYSFTVVYILTVDEIEKKSGIDFNESDGNSTVVIKDSVDSGVLTGVNSNYTYTVTATPVMYKKSAGLSGRIMRNVTAGSSIPAEGVTVTATVSIPSVMTFTAVTDSDGYYSIPDDMPASYATISTEATYYDDEDLWYPSTVVAEDVQLRDNTTSLDAETLSPSEVRPLILSVTTGTVLEPIDVDDSITVIFSVDVDSVQAELSMVEEEITNVPLLTAIDDTGRIVTISAKDYFDYGLDGISLSISGETVDGEVISDSSITLYTVDSVKLIGTNLFDEGLNVYDQPGKRVDFPITGENINFDFDQQLESFDISKGDHAELYWDDEGEGVAVSVAAITSENSLIITIEETLVTGRDYFVAFQVRSNRANDYFTTVIDDGNIGATVNNTMFPEDFESLLVYKQLYDNNLDDEFVVFQTVKEISLISASIYNVDDSNSVIYSVEDEIIGMDEMNASSLTNVTSESVSNYDDITLTFSKTLLDSYDYNENVKLFTLDDDANEIIIDTDISISEDILTISPIVPLAQMSDSSQKVYGLTFNVAASSSDISKEQTVYFKTAASIYFDEVNSNIFTVETTVDDDIIADPVDDLSIDSNIILVFDRDIAMYNISIKENGTNSYESINISHLTADTLTINPVSSLKPDTIYDINLYVLADGGAENDYMMDTISFTTESAITLTGTNFGHFDIVDHDENPATTSVGVIYGSDISINKVLEFEFSKDIDITQDNRIYILKQSETGYEIIDSSIAIKDGVNNVIELTPSEIEPGQNYYPSTKYYIAYKVYASETDYIAVNMNDDVYPGSVDYDFNPTYNPIDESLVFNSLIYFETENTALIADLVQVSNLSKVSPNQLDYNDTNVVFRWNRAEDRSDKTIYRLYAVTQTGVVPIMITPGNYIINDINDTTNYDKQRTTIESDTIDLSLVFDNNPGVFYGGNEIEVYVTASRSDGTGESIPSSTITLKDTVDPIVWETANALSPISGLITTMTFEIQANEDLSESLDDISIGFGGLTNPTGVEWSAAWSASEANGGPVGSTGNNYLTITIRTETISVIESGNTIAVSVKDMGLNESNEITITVPAVP